MVENKLELMKNWKCPRHRKLHSSSCALVHTIILDSKAKRVLGKARTLIRSNEAHEDSFSFFFFYFALIFLLVLYFAFCETQRKKS